MVRRGSKKVKKSPIPGEGIGLKLSERLEGKASCLFPWWPAMPSDSVTQIGSLNH
jgi:hypothetical protein